MQVAINTFSAFTLTEQEQLRGSTLTYDQKLFIQNQISLIAEEKIALVPDPEKYAVFIQQEAHLAGQLAAYKYLLDCSLASEAALLDQASQAQ